jgi:xanthosine utilization system XapX-like protein
MRKKTLIVVDADPLRSHRPAEALRLAAGLAACGTTDVSLYLAGPAIALLGTKEDLMGEEDVRLAWPVLEESSVAVFADRIPAAGTSVFESVRQLEPGGLARLAAEMDYSLRF